MNKKIIELSDAVNDKKLNNINNKPNKKEVKTINEPYKK